MNSARIRKAKLSDADGIAKVRDDTWRTTYRGLVPEEVLDRLSYQESSKQFLELLQNAAKIVYVAQEGSGNIIGFCVGGRERTGNVRYAGEVYAIYLLQTWQRTGIGRQMMLTLAGGLYAAGNQSMLVRTLVTNPYRRFYEALGGVVIGEKTEEIQEAEMQLVAYGWDDIGLLLRDNK